MGGLSAGGPPPARPHRPPPTPAQRRAANPDSSVWVTASAGTGKTRVLSDRVLRLLVAGTDPLRILCLTFTKAAAAEMVNRIQKDLGRFATWPESDLAIELERLLGRTPREAERVRARCLLAQVLELPAGLPVMTIHGFCQSLLRRFPLEAGVPPHFEVIEPRDADDLLRQAREDVLADAEGAVRGALNQLAVVLGEASLREGLGALRDDRLRLTALLRQAGGVEAVIDRLGSTLGVAAGLTLERLTEEICSDPALDAPELRAACRALATGNVSDGERALIIAAWLDAAPVDRRTTYRRYEAVFLTKGRQPRRNAVISAECARLHPHAGAALLAEQQRLADGVEREKAVRILERTAALLRVGAAVIERYDTRKDQQAALDYDDLIASAGALLRQTGISSWVNYKLDQQIDHLLVDEGQDTSPEQWAIIEALCEEYFAGEGARAGRRTLFVVGDEKQSIFSFQGADLETFQRLHLRFAERARAARASWREEPLNTSFRSARAILEVVDAVFAPETARDGVATGATWPVHETARTDAPGSVEIWPLIEVEAQPRIDSWQLPDQHESVDRAEQKAARLITQRIREWLRDGVPLASTGHPIRPGDVMVILPRRGVLQDLLIRELKRHNVPVAGADRLALTDEIAVMDLIALGHALLLPEDELTLAAVLRSPLFGLSEEDLFELAYERGPQSLYRRLRERREERPQFALAWQRYADLLAQADYLPPFELYARLLGEGGGRRRLAARLGPAALEPIEAFLAQALAYERSHPPSLQGFLHWLGADTTELVRDPDRPRDEVRVLTVHGAKGLEAPVVFIGDATFVPSQKDRLLWIEPEGLPAWRVKKEFQDPVSATAEQRMRARELREHRRLLYVAMTRAKDHLIVTAWKRDRQSEPGWYELITAARDALPGAELLSVPDLEGEGWRYASRMPAARRQWSLDLRPPEASVPIPAWLDQPVRAEPALASPLSPSRLLEEGEPPAFSPLGQADGQRFLRGKIIHRLLQSLPERPVAERGPTMARYLAQPAFGLSDGQQAEIADEVQATLALPELAPLLGPGASAEVALVGVVGEQVIAGQVDRLAVTEDAVFVVDYKTNREPPASPAEIPLLYWRQMAAYAALLEDIYPGRRICCALLWTDGPHLMRLDEGLLRRHWPALKGPPGRTTSA